jgi:polyisoprenoid-binding protein YceI
LNEILRQFLKKSWLIAFPFLACFVLLFFQKYQLDFQEYPVIFDFKNLLIIPIFTVLLPLILKWKATFLKEFVAINNIENSMFWMGFSILIFVALFFGNNFGLLLAATFYFMIENQLNSNSEKKTSHSLFFILLSFLIIFVKESQLELPSILNASSLLGLAMGTGIYLWVSSIKTTDKLWKVIFSLVLPIILVVAFTFLDLVKEHIGGLSAFVGIILALFLNSNTKNKSLNFALISIYCGIIVFALPLISPKQEEPALNSKIEKISKTDDKISSPFNLPGKDLNAILGTWKIKNTAELASKIDFELGPKDARTKGIFKIVEGNITFEKSISSSKFEIKLPLEGFSTFNAYRDEGLLNAEYFETSKFPTLNFQSKSLEKLGDIYNLTGTFTLKGISKKLTIQVKLIDFGSDKEGEYAILVGKSSLDRSKHGMKSDPKIGDLVEFSFEIELRK